MTYRVVIQPQVYREIDLHASWWADRYSLDQAIRWSDTIFDQLETLSQFPERFALAPENDEFRYEIRSKLVGLESRPSHRAVFTIKSDTVYVLTVRHSSQDALRPQDVEPPQS